VGTAEMYFLPGKCEREAMKANLDTHD